MREYIKRIVEECWARVRERQPDMRGELYAIVPIPLDTRISDIPHIPGCIRIEIMQSRKCPNGKGCSDTMCFLHQPDGLKFYTRVE